MPRARKYLVRLEDTPYYHITSRCVRRTFLCGFDPETGTSYQHRRRWIEDRIRALSALFSIEICAYSVMSNHYHLVVRIDGQEPERWSDDEVLERWTALFKGPLLVQRYRSGAAVSSAERDSLSSMIKVFRTRLGSLSWFMKCLNEPIARKANAEDRCSGHFWESRFHSQALCSEKAVLTAMAYVDLNPIRANVANTLETSDFTSIKARLAGDIGGHQLILAISRLLRSNDLAHFQFPIRPLRQFADIPRELCDSVGPSTDELPIRERDYIQLVDAAGRMTVPGKRGCIDPTLNPILEGIGVSGEEWLQASVDFRKYYRNAGPITKTA